MPAAPCRPHLLLSKGGDLASPLRANTQLFSRCEANMQGCKGSIISWTEQLRMLGHQAPLAFHLNILQRPILETLQTGVMSCIPPSPPTIISKIFTRL